MAVSVFMPIVGCVEGDPKLVSYIVLVACILRLILFLPILISAYTLVSSTDEIDSNLQSMATLLNGCTDQYTTIDFERNQREMMWIKDSFAQIELIANIILFLYLLNIVAYALYMTATYCHSYEEDAQHEIDVQQARDERAAQQETTA